MKHRHKKHPQLIAYRIEEAVEHLRSNHGVDKLKAYIKEGLNWVISTHGKTLVVSSNDRVILASCADCLLGCDFPNGYTTEDDKMDFFMLQIESIIRDTL